MELETMHLVIIVLSLVNVVLGLILTAVKWKK